MEPAQSAMNHVLWGAMTIDTTGKWWVGSEAKDVEEYLRALKPEGHPVHDTRVCQCTCGSLDFGLRADRNEGCARKTCFKCGTKSFLGDSAEYWKDATPRTWKCTECGSKVCNLAVGFSLYEADPGEAADVRWISVGQRCVKCGTLGSFVDWKVAYGPSHHLLEQV